MNNFAQSDAIFDRLIERFVHVSEPALPLEKRQERGEAIGAGNRRSVDADNQFVGERESLPVSSRSSGRRGGHGTVPEFHQRLARR